MMIRWSFLCSGLFSFLLIHSRIWAVPIDAPQWMDMGNLGGFEPEKSPVEADLNHLIHVHVIFRHGDRNPSILMPTDTGNPATSWLEGRSELTPRGVEAEFRLGQLIRKRYSTFIPKWYSGSTLYVRSSDYNRTLMSAQAVMAGIFPVEGNGVPQPVPIHTIDVEKDRVINDGIRCLASDREDEKMFEKLGDLEEANADLFEILNKESGFRSVRLWTIWKVYDSLLAEKLHNRQWPTWMSEELFQRIQILNDAAAFAQFNTSIQLRLRVGPLMTEITNRMRRKLLDREDAQSQRMALYSGHDATVAGILRSLGYRPERFPQFSSAVFLELHRTENARSPVVRIFYKNATDGEDLYELKSKRCPFGCRFGIIESLDVTLSARTWEQECMGDQFSVMAEAGTAHDTNYSFWILVLTGVLVILALIILTVQLVQLWFSKYRVLKL